MPAKIENELEFFCKDIQIDRAQSLFVPRHLLLQWHLTEKCNQNCAHCYQMVSGCDDELDKKTLLRVAGEFTHLLRVWNIRGHVNITGGEPLLHNDLFNIIEKLAGQNPRCGYAILSNGTLLDDFTARNLKKFNCRFFQVSLDGDSVSHDAIRGEGNFDAVVKSLILLRKHRIPSMVSFTASKRNSARFFDVVKLCHKIGVDVLWTDRFVPEGQAADKVDDLFTPEELKDFIEKAYRCRLWLRRKIRTKTELRLHRALQFLVLEKHQDHAYPPYSCEAGRGLLTVMADGSLVPCRRMPIAVGNMRHNSIADLYQNSFLFKRLRDPASMPRDCKECPHAAHCRGGLKCLSYALHGNPFCKDPQCFYNTSTDATR